MNIDDSALDDWHEPTGGRPTPPDRFKANPRSRKAAIDVKCWDCMNAEANPSPHWLIGICTSPECALWPFRPYQGHYGRPTPPMYR